MNWAELLWGVLFVVLLLDLRRISGRLRSMARLRPDEAEDDSSLCWVTAPGVILDEETRLSALAHMKVRGLVGLELIPAKLPLSMAWSMGCHIDPEAHRADSTRPGDTGLHAFVVPASALEGFGVDQAGADLASFLTLAREVRRRIDGPHDIVISPTLKAQASNPFFDSSALEVKLGGSVAPVAFGIPVATTLMLVGPLFAPWMGSLALLVHLLQQPLSLRQTGFQVRLPWLQGLLRPIVDLSQWLFLIRGKSVSRDQIDGLRPVYDELMSSGTSAFFEDVAEACPICSSVSVSQAFVIPDLYQGKPGSFGVYRCVECQARFQNPRLSMAGLNFYYRDFYDGIGEDALDSVFGATKDLYAARIAMVQEHGAPESWLDVGCGHGHLFAHVRDAMPETTLIGLDMGDGVDIALARGWIDEAHRGLFPECAPRLEGRFDIVSMCHYLEHTLDIRSELAAAHRVLSAEGLLLIEVPDPQSLFARILGRWWMPWFQPQHIQFVTTVGMSKLLREQGFEPVTWHTGRAHTANDFVLAFAGIVRRWAPKLHVPWRPKPSLGRRLLHTLVWIPGTVLIGLGILLDQAFKPLGRRLHHTSQYRVIARKV